MNDHQTDGGSPGVLRGSATCPGIWGRNSGAFARAQELLHENKVHARRRTIEPSLVQGLVSCRKCGYAFSRISTRSTARRIQ